MKAQIPLDLSEEEIDLLPCGEFVDIGHPSLSNIISLFECDVKEFVKEALKKIKEKNRLLAEKEEVIKKQQVVINMKVATRVIQMPNFKNVA